MIQEAFIESGWNNAEQVLRARDQRAEQLQGQGFICRFTTLYRATDGYRVFWLEAQQPESSKANKRGSSPSKAPVKRIKPRELNNRKIDFR